MRSPGVDSERLWRRQRWRLVRLALLSAVVGVAVGGLYAAGILGSVGGGVEAARLLATVPPPGVAVSAVGAEVGRLAPDFEFSNMEGRRLRLSAFRGRPVYLNFWASWCVPCRREMPDIVQLERRHQGEGLVVVSLNRGERLERARSFLKELGVKFGVNGMDPLEAVYKAYSPPFKPMPISVFIDREGIVRGYHLGQASLEQMEELYARTVRP